MMNRQTMTMPRAVIGLSSTLFGFSALALEVMITPRLDSQEVRHEGKPVVIQRNQNPANAISSEYAKTSRPCPPFCISRQRLAEGVDTIGELEVLEYLRQATQGEPVLVIDARTSNWLAHGTIPGSVNIPWVQLAENTGGNPIQINAILSEQFGVAMQDGLWNFSQAKTLVIYDNGPWCGQAPANLRVLLKYGYPPAKLKWYRDGMQMWKALGLTSIP
jgi:rhodanese-related sulfurtransferase